MNEIAVDRTYKPGCGYRNRKADRRQSKAKEQAASFKTWFRTFGTCAPMVGWTK